uniref:NADH-ubiquinone oxidoreductase chain 4 n=1 Tax=Ryssota otaheitana TaxID=2595071 RepID=A0A5B8FJM2_9EUPU|nr:NADH dehydrogenase subunit 4 [Ryssota otaheitana]QDM39459.1 NADH dehydrogenase subunit 4 [Ryssota otaheitana]
MLSMISMLYLSLMFISWESTLVMSVLSILFCTIFLYKNFMYTEYLIFMFDSASTLMMFLTSVLLLLCLLCSYNMKMKSFIFYVLFLVFVLFNAFSVNNIMLFYVWFEVSLIPTLVLIIGWGYQPERLQAGSYMMLYTVGASLPLLFFIIDFGGQISAYNIYMILSLKMSTNSNWYVMACVLAFLVKLPMYLFHLWLPKAHVEAPLAGSMLLAGVLLKLGGYGLFLMLKMNHIHLANTVLMVVLTVSLWGGLLAGLMCLRQSDIKAFVAYSSISHMALVIAAVLINTAWGLAATMIIMVSHGFTSPAMFFLAYMTYLKSGSRSLMYTTGFLSVFPILSMMWFLVLMISMAAPPSINFVGELLMMPMLMMLNWTLAFNLMLLMLVSAILSMYLYTSVNHGSLSKFLTPGQSMIVPMYIGTIIHVVPLLFILKMHVFF